MNIIEQSSDMEMLVGSVKDTGGVYFVTAFSGLLAPYWDREAVCPVDSLQARTDGVDGNDHRSDRLYHIRAYRPSSHRGRLLPNPCGPRRH
jgi:hypothetical protein